jgi:CysZ protein
MPGPGLYNKGRSEAAAMSDLPKLARRGNPLDFFWGASLPVRAALLVLRTPRLRALAVLCAAVTLLVFCLWGWALWAWLPEWLGQVWSPPRGSSRFVWQLTAVLTGALLWLVGAAILPLLALAPLQDPLVAATEAAVGSPPAPAVGALGGARQAVKALGHTALRVALLLVGQALLLVLQLAVPAGAMVWWVAGWGWTALWACAEYLDAPLSRRDRPFSEVRQVLVRRTSLALGFGLALTLLLWIPLVNLFLVPVAVAAGTLLHRSLVAAGTLSDGMPEDSRTTVG